MLHGRISEGLQMVTARSLQIAPGSVILVHAHSCGTPLAESLMKRLLSMLCAQLTAIGLPASSAA